MTRDKLDRQRWRGTIAYRTMSGASTGEERFTVAEHGDGSLSLRALCHMDDLGLVRDALLVLDPAGGPSEAFVRIVESGRHSGSALYRFGGSSVEAMLSLSGETRRIRLNGPPRFFGTHSLVNDAWLARLVTERIPGKAHRFDDIVTCSHEADGGNSPGLMVGSATLTFEGEEERTSPAGAFACRRWSVAYGEFPPLFMWTTGPLELLVRMEWSHLGGCYELTELVRDDP
ncbi:MAG: hypothetical protein V2I27_13810 [Erythrobacter sp.]|jgi:hypothetical protein|nr:hypothetical protein [Erythrobacter sp.]